MNFLVENPGASPPVKPLSRKEGMLCHAEVSQKNQARKFQSMKIPQSRFTKRSKDHLT